MVRGALAAQAGHRADAECTREDTVRGEPERDADEPRDVVTSLALREHEAEHQGDAGVDDPETQVLGSSALAEGLGWLQGQHDTRNVTSALGLARAGPSNRMIS